MVRPSPAPRWIPGAGAPPRILLVKLSALGDVLHALPVLAAIRRELPHALVDWVVEDRAADLLQNHPGIARLVVLPRRELRTLRRRPGAWARRAVAFVRELRRHPYDVALDLQGNLKSGVVTRLSGARVRFGLDHRLAKEGGHLFTNRHARPARDARHRVERNLALLASLLGRDVEWVDPSLPPHRSDAERAERLLGSAALPPRGYVVLHPGTSAFGAFKRWPPDRFADLARLLAARGETVVVTSPPGEQPIADAVARAANGAATVLPVPGLAALAEVTRRAKLLVAADTGPLHLAALAGTPLVGLYGPKDPFVYGPYGRRRDGTVGPLAVVVRDDVACRPCRLRTCADPVCMGGLDAERVLSEIDATLGA